MTLFWSDTLPYWLHLPKTAWVIHRVSAYSWHVSWLSCSCDPSPHSDEGFLESSSLYGFRDSRRTLRICHHSIAPIVGLQLLELLTWFILNLGHSFFKHIKHIWFVLQEIDTDLSRPASQNTLEQARDESTTHICKENTQHIYTLSLGTKNKHNIHKSTALFISIKHIQSQDLYNKRYDKRK